MRGLVLQKAYDLFYELTLLCNRSPFAVEKVIAATIAPKRQGNGLVLWIENSDQPSASSISTGMPLSANNYVSVMGTADSATCVTARSGSIGSF